MRFTLDPGEGLKKYLGAWGHMLTVSDDLIDMIHAHPFIADGGPESSSIWSSRGAQDRVWVQVQRAAS